MMTEGEKRALVVALLDQADIDDISGFVVIGIREEGNLLLSNAASNAVIIKALCSIAESLATQLAEGIDAQAEGVARNKRRKRGGS